MTAEEKRTDDPKSTTATRDRGSKHKDAKTGGAGDATLESAFARADQKSEEIQGLMEQRGAGSGEFAVATRIRDYNEDPVEAVIEPTEWPEGDIDKGRLDPEASLPNGGQLIAQRDRRAYLIKQAEQNEAANDELNFIQTEQNRKLGIVSAVIQDPDWQRENSMVSAVADLKMHDREEMLKTRPERQRLREEKSRERRGLPPEDASKGKAVHGVDNPDKPRLQQQNVNK